MAYVYIYIYFYQGVEAPQVVEGVEQFVHLRSDQRPSRVHVLPVVPRLGSKQRDPDPKKNSLVRRQFRRHRMEFLICRCFLSNQEVFPRVGAPSFASHGQLADVPQDGLRLGDDLGR